MNSKSVLQIESINIDQYWLKSINTTLPQQSTLLTANYYIQCFNMAFYEKLMKIKLLNLIKPIKTTIGNDIVTMEFEPSEQFTPQKSSSNQSRIELMVFLQLSIILQELNRREVPINKITTKQIYIVDRVVCISMMNFDYINPPNSNCSLFNFKKLINKHAPNYANEINQYTTFAQITEYLIYMCELQEPMSIVSCPYLRLLQTILEIQNPKLITPHFANAYVYRVNSSNILSRFRSNKQSIIKSTKLSSSDQQETLKNIDRELTLMESFSCEVPLAICYAYVRIMDQCFLIMDNYPMDLLQYMQEYLSNRNQVDRVMIYTLCKQLAETLEILHKHNIIHRDLKPSNILLSDTNVKYGQLVIADFDRAKRFEINIENTQPHNTIQYDPPESGQSCSLNSDIWQYGLICFQIANLGVYPGFSQGAFIHQQNPEVYYQHYGFEKIQSKLQSYNYSIEFLQLIADCLKLDPLTRPAMQDIVQRIRKVYLSSKCTIIIPNTITSNSGNTNIG